jgi:hypothetical protein
MFLFGVRAMEREFPMPRVFLVLWVILSTAAVAGAQQSSNQPDLHPLITDPAEYADYMTALDTVDAAARQAALNDFVRRYPNSVIRDQVAYTLATSTHDPVARLAALDDFVNQYPDSPLRDKAEEMYMASLILLDHQRTAPLRQQLREASEKTGPIAWERACRMARERAPETLSYEDWKFILQFRDAGPDCNRGSAEKVWQQIQKMQRTATGPSRLTLYPVLVLNSNPKYLYAAFTDSKQVREPDLRITLKDPTAKRPAPGEAVTISGFISNYSKTPFMFILSGAEIVPANQANGHRPAKMEQQQPFYPVK